MLRAYFNDAKAVYNYFKYPQMYVNAFCCLLDRNWFDSLDEMIKSSNSVLPFMALVLIELVSKVISYAIQVIGFFINLAINLMAVVASPIVGGVVFSLNQAVEGSKLLAAKAASFQY